MQFQAIIDVEVLNFAIKEINEALFTTNNGQSQTDGKRISHQQYKKRTKITT